MSGVINHNPQTKMLQCQECERWRYLAAFAIIWNANNEYVGREPICKKCKGKMGKDPEKMSEEAKDKFYQSEYGLTLAQVQAMSRAQGDVCAICHEKKFLVVDHDHETGKVRGLLCYRCNTFIGGHKNLAFFQSVVLYLTGSDS